MTSANYVVGVIHGDINVGETYSSLSVSGDMNRRRFLVATRTALAPLISGCSSSTSSDFDPDIDPVTRLGGASSVSVEAEPIREYEYLEESDRVRIHYDSGQTSTMSFDEWGTRRATDHAADHVHTILTDESPTGTGISVGVGEVNLTDLDSTGTDQSATESAFEWDVNLGVTVSYEYLYSRDGDLISEPDISFQTVVDVTPRSAEVTMLFPQREYTAILPVVCRRRAIRYD